MEFTRLVTTSPLTTQVTVPERKKFIYVVHKECCWWSLSFTATTKNTYKKTLSADTADRIGDERCLRFLFALKWWNLYHLQPQCILKTDFSLCEIASGRHGGVEVSTLLPVLFDDMEQWLPLPSFGDVTGKPVPRSKGVSQSADPTEATSLLSVRPRGRRRSLL